MNEIYKELAKTANPDCSKFYNNDWAYNCAAWTGEEINNLIELVLSHAIEVATEHCLSTKPLKNAHLKMEVVDCIREHFGLDADHQEQ